MRYWPWGRGGGYSVGAKEFDFLAGIGFDILGWFWHFGLKVAVIVFIRKCGLCPVCHLS